MSRQKSATQSSFEEQHPKQRTSHPNSPKQRSVRVQVIDKRNWADTESSLEEGLPKLQATHKELQIEFRVALAKAKGHLSRDLDDFLKAAEVWPPASSAASAETCACQMRSV